jgi:uncharacterized membrane protein YeiB
MLMLVLMMISMAEKNARIIRHAITSLLLLPCFLVAGYAQTTTDSKPCEGGTVANQGLESAQKLRSFLTTLQTAVASADKTKVASMISYPLLVIHGASRTKIKSKAELITKYDTIFDERIRQVIAQQSARCLFGNYQGVMIGNGEVWFTEQPDGPMKIMTINPTAGAQQP